MLSSHIAGNLSTFQSKSELRSVLVRLDITTSSISSSGILGNARIHSGLRFCVVLTHWLSRSGDDDSVM